MSWFETYKLSSLRSDAISGLTVALVLIPQSMAYAQLAGLPPYYGLYAAFLPPIVASLFGSSRQLATGPVAVVSLMTAASLEPIATAGSEAFISHAILLALIVGLFQFLLGVLRLGLVVNFLSHPVINGFTNAAALIIASSQLPKMFGVYVDKGAYHYETVIRVVQSSLYYTHWPTLLIGTFALAIMYVMKRVVPRAPNVLVAVVLTTLISWAYGFDHDQVTSIEAIESNTAKMLIREYNASINEIADLAARRTEISLQIMEGKNHRESSSPNILKLEHQISLNKFESEILTKKVYIYRKKLRRLKFLAVEDGRSKIRFYLKNEMPASLQDDGRNWRLMVGEGILDEDSLPFAGGGDVVGNIPKGLPSLSMPEINGTVMLNLFPYAVIIALLGFMEAISIAKAMAAKSGQRLDPNQELIGQGLANMFGALGQSYPVSGSFSRSAVNFQAGAITGLSSVFTSLAVVVALLFLTPLLYYLPQSVLAAVIMMAVLGLINVPGLIHAWKAQWYDGVIAIITFICTLLFAPHLDRGIFVGIVLSLSVFLYKSMRPRVAILSKHLDGSYHDAETYGLKLCKHIAMVRFDGQLFFANASYLEDQIARLRISMPKLKHILIVASGIDDMDASGEEALSLIVDRVRSAGYEISFSGLKKNILDVMKRTYLYQKIGKEHIFPTQALAVSSIHEAAHRDTTERACPLTNVSPLFSEDVTRQDLN